MLALCWRGAGRDPEPAAGGGGGARGGCGSGRIGPVHSGEEEEKMVTPLAKSKESDLKVKKNSVGPWEKMNEALKALLMMRCEVLVL